jgi:hypothetical protein
MELENYSILIVTNGLMEAEIIKTKLDSHNIQCALQFESIGRLYGIISNGLGKVQVLVKKDQYELAQNLIKTDEPKNPN